MKLRLAWFSLLSAGSFFADLQSAHACSGRPCGSAALVRDPTADAPRIPANTQALTLDGASSTAQLQATIVEVSDTGSREVSYAWTPRAGMVDLQLNETLTPGSRLVIQGTLRDGPIPDGGCGTELSGDWSVQDAAPLPALLGTLDVSYGFETVKVGGGPGCWEEPTASIARIRVMLDPSARPWQSQLVYQTWVDGTLWNPVVSIGGLSTPGTDPGWPQFIGGGSQVAQARGQDILYRTCEDRYSVPQGTGLSDGPHQVEMRARVPGTDTWLSTGTHSITLTPCAQREDAAVPDAGPSSDGGAMSQPSPQEMDAGQWGDRVVDLGVDVSPRKPKHGGACSLTPVSGQRHTDGLFPMLGILFTGLSLRRASRRVRIR